MTAEHRRLEQARTGHSPWKKWGPYLSERQWGTVREDYSESGDAWKYFTHDQARSRAYRWGEDGLAGLSDDRQLLCFALVLWNGKGPILEERLFGLDNNEGNHGEDVKPDWRDDSHSIAFTVEMRRDALLVHFIFNAYWEPLEFELPPAGGSWRRWIDTALDSPQDIVPWETAPPLSIETYRVEAHSVVVLFAATGTSRGRR